MSEVSRSTLASMGLALCDELSERGAGEMGRVDRRAGTYDGDTFLDEIFRHLAPDMAEPDNGIGDEVLAERLAHAGDYLRGLALGGQLREEDVDAILAAVDLSPLGVTPEPQPDTAGQPQQILQPDAPVAIAGTLF